MERQQGSPGPRLLLLHQALTSDPSVSPFFFLQYAGNSRHDTHPLIHALHLESYRNKGIIDSEGLLQCRILAQRKIYMVLRVWIHWYVVVRLLSNMFVDAFLHTVASVEEFWCWVRKEIAPTMRMWRRTRSSRVSKGCCGKLAGQPSSSLLLVFDGMQKIGVETDARCRSIRGIV